MTWETFGKRQIGGPVAWHLLIGCKWPRLTGGWKNQGPESLRNRLVRYRRCPANSSPFFAINEAEFAQNEELPSRYDIPVNLGRSQCRDDQWMTWRSSLQKPW